MSDDQQKKLIQFPKEKVEIQRGRGRKKGDGKTGNFLLRGEL